MFNNPRITVSERRLTAAFFCFNFGYVHIKLNLHLKAFNLYSDARFASTNSNFLNQ